MSLVTRCPKCKSAFDVVIDQLRLRDGLVRCGQCSHVFDGYASLETELPTLTRVATSATQASPVSLEPPPAYSVEVEPAPAVIRHRSLSPEQDEGPRLQLTEDEDDFDSKLTTGHRAAPDFLEDDDPPAVVARILWALGIFAALVILCVQLIFIYRNDIALAAPALRPVLSSWCSKIGCEVGYSRRLERISIEASSLQQVAGSNQDNQNSNMNLRFTLRNRYDQPQPWPSLVLSLTDASGTVVVRKVVPHYQYLPPTLIDQAFRAGQEVNLLLPLNVSGLQINGFQIEKFFP